MKNNLLVYILLCLLNLSWANARNKQQEAEALIKKSVEALYNNPKQASYYAAKVIELFPEERQNDQKAEAMFYYSQAEKLLGNFDVSIKNLYDALEYATPANKELNGQIAHLFGMRNIDFAIIHHGVNRMSEHVRKRFFHRNGRSVTKHHSFSEFRSGYYDIA